MEEAELLTATQLPSMSNTTSQGRSIPPLPSIPRDTGSMQVQPYRALECGMLGKFVTLHHGYDSLIPERRSSWGLCDGVSH